MYGIFLTLEAYEQVLALLAFSVFFVDLDTVPQKRNGRHAQPRAKG